MPSQLLDEDFHLVKEPEWVKLQQQAYRILGHGRLCPYCKKTIMWWENMVMVRRIFLPRIKDQIYPSWVYYHKMAWDWVCTPECADSMRAKWRDSITGRPSLFKRILEAGPIRAIPAKKKESYRQQILRLARIAVDPGYDIVNPVKHPYFIDLTT